MRLEDPNQDAADGGRSDTEPAATADDPAKVIRHVDVDAPTDDVWDVVADPERRALWLDDEDALQRTTTSTEVRPGRSISWTWWHPGDDSSSSQVEITVAPAGSGTRVTITEQLLAPRPVMRAQALSQTGLASSGLQVWDRRLLGLELTLLARGASLCLVS